MATFAFGSGAAAVQGYGQRAKFRFSGTWAAGDSYLLQFNSTEGDFTLGKGNISGGSLTCGITLNNRIFVGNGSTFNFCAIGDPTGWEEQDTGAGYVEALRQFGVQDIVNGFASFQGKLAVFGRHNTTIWNIDADPANFTREQVLRNIGTFASQSIQGLGQLDVLFLDDTGVRSLRARENTLNAFPIDLGSPIDTIIQAVLLSLSESEKATAVSVVEPVSKRYWLYLSGVIYVFSYYESSKIIAWSTYLPTYELDVTITGNYSGANPGVKALTGLAPTTPHYWTKGANDTSITNGVDTLTSSGWITSTDVGGLTMRGITSAAATATLYSKNTFSVKKFVVKDFLVYARVALTTESNLERLVVLGGTAGTTYDRTVCTAELPWLDDKSPTMAKKALGFDAAFSGNWTFSFGCNPEAGTLENVGNAGSKTAPDENVDSPFDIGHIGLTGIGTHFKLKLVTSPESAVKAVLSNIVLHYNLGSK